MPIIDKASFVTIINISVIDKLIGGDDSIIDALIETAQDEMKAFLQSRYDTVLIFDGGSSTYIVRMYCKDMTLYHLFSRSNQSQIPLIRETRYKAAIEWLINVQEQKINPYGLPLLSESEKALVKAGGNTKRNNHQE